MNMQSPPSKNEPRKPKPPVPEMVGATSAPFEIGPGVTEISFAIHQPTGPAKSHGDASPRQVMLHIDNITGNKRAPRFSVYLNVPRGADPVQHPELTPGSLTLFGLTGASQPDSEHGGTGMSFELNASEVVAHLIATNNWDPANLRVTFVPGDWDAPVPKVRVGRVSLYFA